MKSGRISYFFQSLIFATVCLSSAVFAQSTDQNFPTPLASSTASGTIRARDVGDSRLTTYYYVFNGGQGDIFINVTTTNFNGDIDVFTVEAMRPLTKMLIFADITTSETGRLIYLRKPERLVLRIQGRSPNDDPALFQIKFGGSFVASSEKGIDEPKAPEVESDPSGSVRVNSVGTIIETPKIDKPVAKIETPPSTPLKDLEQPSSKPSKKVKKTGEPDPEKDEIGEMNPAKTKDAKAKAKSAPVGKKPTPKKEEPQPDPLANVRLVIAFKNGDKLERPLPEILKFSVDKGILTVIAKDGAIRRYSMIDVAKVTIE